MVFYDGIIYSLQSGGGISVLFNELISRMPVGSYELNLNAGSKYLARYRSVQASAGFDIFHSTYYRLPTKKKCEIVTTVHDYTYERYSTGLKKSVHSWQKNKAIRAADKIICVSESTRRDLLEFTGHQNEQDVVVVHNGVSSEYFPIQDRVLLDQILFVGARGGYKNFLNTVHAIAATTDMTLLCVGGGPFTDAELNVLNKSLPDRFSHAGYITNKQLNLEYNRSLCLVYPSLYEGFGIPVLEAMRAGCPVVAVNTSSIPEVAGSAAILLERGAVEEIRTAIEYLYATENRNYYISRGFVQSEKFSWDKTYSETVALYEQLLAQK